MFNKKDLNNKVYITSWCQFLKIGESQTRDELNLSLNFFSDLQKKYDSSKWLGNITTKVPLLFFSSSFFLIQYA